MMTWLLVLNRAISNKEMLAFIIRKDKKYLKYLTNLPHLTPSCVTPNIL